MLTVVFDATSLITACKFAVNDQLIIDYLSAGCRIVIAPRVEEEVAVLGASYADGVAAGERIVRGDIQVVPVAERRWERYLGEYALGQGEKDSMELCAQTEEAEACVTDDYLAFVAATRQGLKVWMLPDLIVELVRRGTISLDIARALLDVMRTRYRTGVIAHSLAHLQEVKATC